MPTLKTVCANRTDSKEEYNTPQTHSTAKLTINTKSKNLVKPQKKRSRKESDELKFTKLLLTNIALRHPEDKQISCDICDYRTIHRYRMQLHMGRLHRASSTSHRHPYECAICGVQMSELGNLKIHMRSHTGEKPFACSFESCDRRFASSGQRTIHMRRHLGEKPFQCDECTDAFITKNLLTSHKQRRHSDQRPFHCDDCGSSFKVSAAYRKHRLTHSDVRKYHCDVCGRSFHNQGAFRVHMNIHTDNRPYKCGICDRGFHSTPARRSHEKSVHKQK